MSAKPVLRMTEAWRVKYAWLRANRREAGLCERCPNPARPGRVQCEACAAKHLAMGLARYRAKTGAIPCTTRRCRACGEQGHTRPRCPKTVPT